MNIDGLTAHADEDGYDPDKKQVEPYESADPDFGSLVDWARAHNYIPKMQSPPWNVFSAFVNAMNEAAGKVADARKAASEAAEKDALELSKEDWNRLKKGETNK